jgi:2-dehydropantoate 2-reductase
VLLCVKTLDTTATVRELAPHLAPEAIVLSLQNGVDSVEQIQATVKNAAFQAVVYVAASVPEPGRIKHVGRGDLVIGPETDRTKMLAALLARAGIPCRISANIDGELWTKLIWNCALNAISALGRAKYRRMSENPDARQLMETVIHEVLAVANAARVVLPGIADEKAAMAGAMQIATQMAEAMSSTAQDLSRGKFTEIDSLNGFIVRRGTELGIATPVNHALFTLVKLAEAR